MKYSVSDTFISLAGYDTHHAVCNTFSANVRSNLSCRYNQRGIINKRIALWISASLEWAMLVLCRLDVLQGADIASLPSTWPLARFAILTRAFHLLLSKVSKKSS